MESGSADLIDIPLEENPRKTTEHKMFLYWIDYAAFSQIFTVLTAVVIIMIIYPLTFLALSETKTKVESEDIPVDSVVVADELHLDLSFNNLWKYKKFIKMEISFITNTDSPEDCKAFIHFDLRMLEKLRIVDVEHYETAVDVTIANGKSLPVFLFEKEANSSYSMMDVMLKIECQCTGITDIRVSWQSGNARAYQLLTYGMATLFAISWVFFQSYCLTFQNFFYLETILSLPLCLLGTLALNPFLYIFNIDIESMFLWTKVFVIYEKIHILYKLKELNPKMASNVTIAGILSAMILYLIIAVQSVVCRENRILLSLPMQRMEVFGPVCDSLYFLFCISAFVSARRADDGGHNSRIIGLCGMIFPLFVSDIIRALRVFNGTIYPDIFEGAAAYCYFGMFVIFFKRCLRQYGVDLLSQTRAESDMSGETLLED